MMTFMKVMMTTLTMLMTEMMMAMLMVMMMTPPPRSSRGPFPCHNLHWRENRGMYPGKPEKGDQDDDVDGICLSSNSVYMDLFPLISCAQ